LIRQAAASGAAVVIVDPDEPERLAPVLAELRDKGPQILLLERTVPVEGKPFPVVSYASAEATAKELVTTALRQAKAGGAAADGPAVLLIKERPTDLRAAARVRTLRDAIKAAGIRLLPDVMLARSGEARPVLERIITSEPRPGIVFTDDEMVLVTAGRSWGDITRGSLPVVVGYFEDRELMDAVGIGGCTAGVDLNFTGFARQAIETAAALARGESVPDRVEVPTVVRAGAGPNRPSFLPRPAKSESYPKSGIP
jgi:ABC-type sugar transport system substrate-binding protein